MFEWFLYVSGLWDGFACDHACKTPVIGVQSCLAFCALPLQFLRKCPSPRVIKFRWTLVNIHARLMMMILANTDAGGKQNKTKQIRRKSYLFT
jgi:hypothetical protein